MRIERLKLDDTKLISYIESRGIPNDISLKVLKKYVVTQQPYGSPVPRKYEYVGIENTKTLSSYYPKMGNISINKGNTLPTIIGKLDAPTAYLFQSQWDFLAFLSLVGKKWEQVLHLSTFYVFNEKELTKPSLKRISLERHHTLKCAFRNERFLRNVKKVYGEDKVIDSSDFYAGFNSLSDMIIGKVSGV